MMRLTDAFLCFPQLFVLIVLGTLIRTTELRVLQGSILPIALVIGILSWMGLARLVRATFLSLKEKEFVERRAPRAETTPASCCAMCCPAPLARSWSRPACWWPPQSSPSRYELPRLRRAAADRDLGQPAARRAAAHAALPIFAIAPGLMIFLTVMNINFIGDGLRDALDPYGRR